MQINNNNLQNLQYNVKNDNQTAKASEAGRSISDAAITNRADMAGNSASITSADAAIEKALEQAGLPRSEKNMTVARELISNQMAVSKDNLMQLIQQSNIYREADVSTLLLMNRNNIPVTHFTAAQLQGYIDNEQNLLNQLGDAVGEFTELLSGDNGPLVNSAILDLLTSSPEELVNAQLTAEAEAVANQTQSTADDSVNQPGAAATPMAGAEATDEISNVTSEITKATVNLQGEATSEAAAAAQNSQSTSEPTAAQGSSSPVIIQAASPEANEASTANTSATLSAFTTPLTPNEQAELSAALKKITGQNTSLEGKDTDALLKEIKEAIQGKDTTAVRDLIASPAYKQLIKNAFGEKFTLNPENIKDSEAINSYYKATYSALSKMMEIAEKSGNEQLADKLSKPMDNVKFMDTLNNVMPFIQLPLKFESGATHGELMIFKNGRNKTSPEDVKSVLLHLDMDNLGPTDIHIKLDRNHLNLKFYCNDDISMNLLSDKISELSVALQNKGFEMTSDFSVRDENKATPLEEALSGQSQSEPAFVYGFDIRA